MFTVWFGDRAAPNDTSLVGPLALLAHPTVGHGDACAWAVAGRGSSVAYDRATGVRTWAWSRLDNAGELRALLTQPEGTDSDLILDGYLRWGTDLPRHLTGDFSVCIYDPRDRSIHAFRDPIGIRPLSVAQANDTTVVTTAPGVLWRLPGFASTPDPNTIIGHATQIRDLAMAAAHPQSRRVTPGVVLTRRRGSATESRYHRFDPHSTWRNAPEEGWVRDFRGVLDSAVAARIPSTGPIGIEFSGGLDSVGIASLIKDLDPQALGRLRAYGFVSLTEEEAAIRAAAQGLGITSLDVTLTKEGRSRTVEVESLLGEPVGHEISTRFTRALVQCADVGGSVMFAGHGGDQCASHFAIQAPQEWIARRKFVGTLRYVLPHRGWRHTAATSRLALQGLRMHQPERPDAAQLAQTLHLRPDALEAAGVIEQLHASCRPLNALSVNADIVTPDGLVQPVTAAYWSRRAEDCTTVASLFGMTYAFPLLDPAVVQQFLTTPTVQKYRNGLGRYLFREALGPTMPASVRWAPSKYLGQPIQRARKSKASPDQPIHPLLADLMPTGASLPPPSTNWGNPYGVHRVNLWLNDHFPVGP